MQQTENRHVKHGATTMPERYAAAFMALAQEQGLLEPVAQDLRTLNSMIKGDAQLLAVLSNLRVTRAELVAVLRKLAEQAQMQTLTRNFLGVLAQNRRAGALPQIISAFMDSLARQQGLLHAKVCSAVALTEAQQNKLVESLRQKLGSKIALELSVEPELIGGLSVQVGATLYDHTVQARMQRLAQQLKTSN